MQLKWPKRSIIVEGNIGVGKSTIAKALAKRHGLRLLREPVDNELLQLFYDDAKRWAFPFQMEMLHRRWALQMSAATEAIVEGEFSGAILDRSIWGDLVFAWKLTESGLMEPKEWEIYISAVRNMSLVLFPPTELLYLDACPEVCLERIRLRNRPQEQGITLDYLRSIDAGYKQLLDDAQSGFYPWSHAVRVRVIPWDHAIADEAEWARAIENLL